MRELLEAPKVKHHVSDAPRAQALALVLRGYTHAHAAELVGVHESTVWRWHQRSKEIQGNKPVLERTHRNTLQALDLIGDGLDIIEEDDTRQLAYKNLQTLNIIAGTGTDKLQKESQPPTLQAQNVIYVFNAAQPEAPEAVEDAVEGEVVKPSEA